MDGTAKQHQVVTLSRSVIEEAALERANRAGVASLSLRRLAEDLAVTPMALYRHVAGKDDLLEAVADARLSALGLPSARVGWCRYLLELARGLHGLFEAEPELLGLFTRRAVVCPAAKARFDSAVAVLTRAGFPRPAAVEAYAAVHTYTIGFCALRAGRASGASVATGLGDPTAAEIASFVTDDQFEFGLGAMLAGLQANTTSRRHGRTAARRT